MLTKAFLSPTEIKERIAQEAASDKDRKLTPEQIEAIYSNGTNILAVSYTHLTLPTTPYV